MKNTPEREQSRGKPEGGVAYRAPQLVEFGDLATRTHTIMSGTGLSDGGGGMDKTSP
jgi:hypothetical protein